MTERTCGGACCVAFSLPLRLFDDPAKVVDGPQIAAMIIPLTRRQAVRRYARLVGGVPPPRNPATQRTPDRVGYFTCRNWDEATRLCMIYETRPGMCRDYPYGGACEHGCGYRVTPDVAARYDSDHWKWDEAADGWRAIGDDWEPTPDARFVWDPETRIVRRRQRSTESTEVST